MLNEHLFTFLSFCALYGPKPYFLHTIQTEG